MPAEITNTDGRDEMFYTGKTPWHGLGTKLDGPANTGLSPYRHGEKTNCGGSP